MADFTPIDAGAAHRAMLNAIEAANSRRSKNPNAHSAESFDQQAAELKVLRDKILDKLPPQFHSHRLAYPDYNLARIAERTKPADALLPDLAP
jgi:hypothetical protein